MLFSRITDSHSVPAVSDCDYTLHLLENDQQSIFILILLNVQR